MQICLSARGATSEPALFLDSGCASLRGAFGFGGLLLKPADEGTPETGSTLTWYAGHMLWDEMTPAPSGASWVQGVAH